MWIDDVVHVEKSADEYQLAISKSYPHISSIQHCDFRAEATGWLWASPKKGSCPIFRDNFFFQLCISFCLGDAQNFERKVAQVWYTSNGPAHKCLLEGLYQATPSFSLLHLTQRESNAVYLTKPHSFYFPNYHWCNENSKCQANRTSNNVVVFIKAVIIKLLSVFEHMMHKTLNSFHFSLICNSVHFVVVLVKYWTVLFFLLKAHYKYFCWCFLGHYNGISIHFNG